MQMIEIENLRKTYSKESVVALDGINLSVRNGEIFGLIGPDGAGKTTLFRLLTTLLKPDSGTATVGGFDIVKDYKQIRKIVGYMPGRFSLYQDLTIEENLRFFATVFGTTIEENYHLIEDIYVQIEPFKHRPAGKLSGGMKQKLALCCALIHEPQVLFLDEPTTGVDPVSRKEFWDMLGRLRHKGMTIMVSTPYMDEASRCDRIALIQKGKIMETDTLADVLAKNTIETYAVSGENKYKLLLDLRAYPGTKYCFAFGAEHHLVLDPNRNDIVALREYLRQKGHPDARISRIDANIEDVFISLMQEDV